MVRYILTMTALAVVITGSPAIGRTPCPPHEPGRYPWTVKGTMPGDLWAEIYLDLDKAGHPLRCHMGKTNMSAPETRSKACKSFLKSWHAAPLMRDGKPVAGTTTRVFVVLGGRHDKLNEEARKRWFAEHPDQRPECFESFSVPTVILVRQAAAN
jgi:hypothetical protein